MRARFFPLGEALSGANETAPESRGSAWRIGPVETAGLKAVVDNNGSAPFYGEEELGGTKYFTAVYADTAIAAACVDCHNEHKDAPRRDFEIGDVMGGVVLRIPM
jgi:hypothetical protein